MTAVERARKAFTDAQAAHTGTLFIFREGGNKTVTDLARAMQDESDAFDALIAAVRAEQCEADVALLRQFRGQVCDACWDMYARGGPLPHPDPRIAELAALVVEVAKARILRACVRGWAESEDGVPVDVSDYAEDFDGALASLDAVRRAGGAG